MYVSIEEAVARAAQQFQKQTINVKLSPLETHVFHVRSLPCDPRLF